MTGKRLVSRKTPNRMPPPMPSGRKQRAPTASALIRGALRARIASLEFLPGQVINEKELATAFGVSRTPVHEAVLKLAEEGLVEIFPQAGTFVSRIPFAALPEVLIIRRALEETSARFAAMNAAEDDLAHLTGTMQALAGAAERNDRAAFHQADEDFHAGLAEAAGYPGIWALTQQVKIQVDRFRRLTLPQEGRMKRVIVEHGAVLDAVRARDAGRAATAMGEHLGGLLADLGGVAGLNPDYFDTTSRAPRPKTRAPSAQSMETA
jgi:DNA-binding GntR family transcriptional regulator